MTKNKKPGAEGKKQRRGDALLFENRAGHKGKGAPSWTQKKKIQTEKSQTTHDSGKRKKTVLPRKK